MAAAALRVGLTGGIGSGKSTAAESLRDRGAVLVDTDAIARELTAPGGSAIAALREHFGPDCIDAHGALDRPWMRQRAFADPGVRRELEALLHPLIGAETERRAGAATHAAGPAACLVFDVPLLVESGRWRQRVDRVLVVDCSESTQIERVARRPGWSREDAQRVIVTQAPRALRRAAADAVIDNDADGLAALHRQVEALWRIWLP
jgi:dephospho-CoA kinase